MYGAPRNVGQGTWCDARERVLLAIPTIALTTNGTWLAVTSGNVGSRRRRNVTPGRRVEGARQPTHSRSPLGRMEVASRQAVLNFGNGSVQARVGAAGRGTAIKPQYVIGLSSATRHGMGEPLPGMRHGEDTERDRLPTVPRARLSRKPSAGFSTVMVRVASVAGSSLTTLYPLLLQYALT